MILSTRRVAVLARGAGRRLAAMSSEQRSAAIHAAADSIDRSREQVLAANAEDLAQADVMLAAGEVTQATYERLRLTEKKIDEMTRSMRAVAELPDPLGRVLQKTELDAGLVLEKVTCPLGLLAVIFEARPDAVTQISALALKSGNAVILKPGAEVEKTASALMHSFEVLMPAFPMGSICMLHGRPAVNELLELHGLIDLVIPRGSRQLIEFVQSNTRIPVLGHAEGICHVYVDAAVDVDMAVAIVDDAKTDYPAACNAAETVLVHEAIAARFIPRLAERLRSKHVRLRGCERTRAILVSEPIEAVADDDWHREYSDLVLAIRVVDSMNEAIEHIDRFGSAHTETIVTEDAGAAERFLATVDSAWSFSQCLNSLCGWLSLRIWS